MKLRTYFRNNRVMESPAHEGGNQQEGDYLRVGRDTEQGFWYISINGNWCNIPWWDVPKEIKVLILLGVA